MYLGNVTLLPGRPMYGFRQTFNMLVQFRRWKGYDILFRVVCECAQNWYFDVVRKVSSFVTWLQLQTLE
jgi:hypothetical protein